MGHGDAFFTIDFILSKLSCRAKNSCILLNKILFELYQKLGFLAVLQIWPYDVPADCHFSALRKKSYQFLAKDLFGAMLHKR